MFAVTVGQWERNAVHRRSGTLILTLASVLAVAGLWSYPAGAAAPPVITISSSTTGTSLTNGSLGLSFEASDLALPGFTGGNLAAYLKTLGQSVIRIGALGG